MPAGSVRPIGFKPPEISSLVNESVVSIHAEEAAFLWTLRNRAIGEPHYSLKDLARLDERVHAHLEGLSLSPDFAWRCSSRMFQNFGPGEAFASSVLAFGTGNVEWMREVLKTASSSAESLHGVISALAWLEWETVSGWLSRLLQSRSPLHRTVAIAAYSAHRQDPGAALREAIEDVDLVLRCRAIKAVGELRRLDCVDQIREYIHDPHDLSRFWAAWALTLTGEPDGPPALEHWVHGFNPLNRRALRTVLRAMSLDDGKRLISALNNAPGPLAPAVMAAGIVGDPQVVAWLIRRMEVPELSRVAGEAFTMITGVDLAFQDLARDVATASAGNAAVEEIVELDYESNLPTPSPRLVREWWARNQETFPAGTRHLAGKPVTEQVALDVLATGKQRQREAAALELTLRHQRPLFEVRAPGARQQAELASWNS